MKEYTVPCVWQMAGDLRIKAKSLKEAVAIAENSDLGLPEANDSYYVDSSFEVNHEIVEFYARTDELEVSLKEEE